MSLPIFAVLFLCVTISLTDASKVSPRPNLKTFQDDYSIVAKTCKAVGFVKDRCKPIHSFRKQAHRHVAFDTRTNGALSINQGYKIIFGRVNLNIGGGYSATKGIFTAPVPGLYVFDWTIRTPPSSNTAYTSLIVNGNRRAYSYCYKNSYNIQMSCSKMAIARMETGDTAWIDSFSGRAYINTYSSFSGFKL